MMDRLSSGIDDFDTLLGGGFLPGSLVMIVGATGVGKTQFGMHFLNQGAPDESVRGAIIDLSSRGDSQNHSGYNQRLFGNELLIADDYDQHDQGPLAHHRPADVLAFLGYTGRRVLRSQMDVDQWHVWQSELNRRSSQLYRFVYNHLCFGTRRFVLDGIEPSELADDSLQLDLVELVYHRMLRQEHDWLAREVLREHFRSNEAEVARRAYNHQEAVAMILVTAGESMLERLIQQPLASGDIAAGANTLILLGKQMDGNRMQRAFYIAKHRGSFADQRIVPFEIGERGIRITGIS